MALAKYATLKWNFSHYHSTKAVLRLSFFSPTDMEKETCGKDEHIVTLTQGVIIGYIH